MRCFTLVRKGETQCSTWGELHDPNGAQLCRILERGAGNPTHPRIRAGVYVIARKPFGASRFDCAFRKLIGADYKGILWLPHVPGRSNIEIHTANTVEQLKGCLATGDDIVRDSRGDLAIAGGTSNLAYARIYPLISAAIESGGAELAISDIAR